MENEWMVISVANTPLIRRIAGTAKRLPSSSASTAPEMPRITRPTKRQILRKFRRELRG